MKKILFCILVAITSFSYANNLSNLEQQRAVLLAKLFSSNIDTNKRLQMINKLKPQLADAEKIVINDKSLKDIDSAMVRNAFANFERTFLIHASVEAKQTILEVYLSSLHIATTDILKQARIGIRTQ